MPELSDIDRVISDALERQAEIEELYAEKRLEHMITYRAKWMLDGCSTISEMIDRFKTEVKDLEEKMATGWKLEEAIHDDYGSLVPPNLEELVENAVNQELDITGQA